MAQYDVTTAGAVFTFADASLRDNDNECVKIDDTHFLNFFTDLDEDGRAQVFAINTSTWAITTAGALFEFANAGTVYNMNSCQVDANHFVTFFRNGTQGQAQVFTVNTSTWAVTTANSALAFETQNNQYNSCCQIDTNHFINFWQGSSPAGEVQVFTVNTTTWAVTTAGSVLGFGINAVYHSCFKVDTNHFIDFYSGSVGDNAYAQVFTVNTTTWAVTTANTALTFLTDDNLYNSCYQIDANHFINFWQEAVAFGGQGFAQVFTVNTTTWAVTTSGTALEFDTALGAYNSCYVIDTNHFINFYRGGADDGFVRTFEVNTSTWAITQKSSLEFDTSNDFVNSCFQVDTNHFINFWGNQSNLDGRVQIFAVEGAASGPANLKTYNTNLKANIKSINTNLIANVKSLNTNI